MGYISNKDNWLKKGHRKSAKIPQMDRSIHWQVAEKTNYLFSLASRILSLCLHVEDTVVLLWFFGKFLTVKLYAAFKGAVYSLT